jgi:serine/threonine-protein kinase
MATLQAGSRVGSYEILAPIGAGGMGEVYRARDSKLGRDVALKVLPHELAEDPEGCSRLVREARAAASLNHPNICTIYEVGEAHSRPYIAMEIVEGQPLSAMLSHAALTLEEIMRYAVQLADALAHAHDRGLTHRDLKSGNVMITREGRVKVVDFGLAKRLSREELADATTAPVALTEPGAIVGTLAYMAPEQLRGQPAVSRSDVWSLGVVLYEMVAGRTPFMGQTAYELSSTILRDPPPPMPARIPTRLQAIITRCLEKEPARRYQQGGEVRSALEVVDFGVGASSAPAYRITGRRWIGLGVGVMLVLAAILVGFNVETLRNRPKKTNGTTEALTRLAVLPFENLTGNPEQDYFSDGLTEEMIAQLSRLNPQRLSVIARTSAMQYKKGNKPINQIGCELGVDYILTGSARSDAGRVRVTAELIQVRDQTQLWSQSYDRELAGILTLQGDVARRIAGSLALALLPAPQSRSRQVNPDAYDAYLKGAAQLNLGGPQGFDTAMRYFEAALKADPNNALAYAGIARTWGARMGIGLVSPGEGAARAREAAFKAIGLDDTRTEAHSVLGDVKRRELDWSGAELEYSRAIELDANDVSARLSYSRLLSTVGRLQEARVQIEAALKLDPFSVPIHHAYALELLLERQPEAAARQWRNITETSPSFVPAHYWLWHVFHVLDGKDDEALGQAEATFAQLADPEVEQALKHGYSEGGYPAAMRQAAAVLESRVPGGRPDTFALANIYVHLGDKNQALKWLEKGFDAGETNTMSFLGQPTFDSPRNDARFQALLRRLNLPK